MQAMLDRFKDQKLIHRRYAFAIILQVCHWPAQTRLLVNLTSLRYVYLAGNVLARHVTPPLQQ